MREPESVYFSCDKFLDDLRAGTLHKDFTLTSETFQVLATRINVDSGLAKEISDSAILLLLGATGSSEVDGILALAEVCHGDHQIGHEESKKIVSDGDKLDIWDSFVEDDDTEVVVNAVRGTE